VPRIRSWFWSGLVGCMLAQAAFSAQPAVRPSETLLPKTTVGFASVANYDNLEANWDKTQLGKLMNDPIMDPFEKDMRAQMQEHWSNIRDRLGISLDDLKGVPSGESAIALIQPKAGAAAMAMLIDITGHPQQAEAMLAKARANLVKQGGKETRQTLGATSVLIYDLPPAAEDLVAAPKAGGASAAAAPPATRQTVYFLTKELLGAADSLEVIRGILARLGGSSQGGSLADVAGFQAVMKRCAADAPGVSPQFRWFIYPLGYAEAARAATPKDKRRKGKTIIEVIRNQGFGAVQGVGGFVDFAPDGYEILHRTAISAPPPYKNSMKMFVLPNKTDFAPQDWVSSKIGTYSTLHVDVLNAFDNFGSLFDELFGEGEKGVWAQTLESLRDDPNGPRIDLRKELMEKLGNRVTMVSDYKLPITTTSERLLFAVEAKDEAAVAKALEKSMKNDPSAKKRVVEGRVIWEIVEEEEPAVPSISLEVPSLTPRKDSPKKDPDEEDKQAHFLPHGAITVAYGQLMVASHIDFLLKVLKPVPPADRLAKNKEFQQVWDTIARKLGIKAQCARSFSFTDEEFRPTYELIRQGKMPESDSLLSRVLNTLSGASRQGKVRKQQIKGEKLPDFEVVRRSLGPGGLCVASEPNGSEPNGWFFKGLLLAREAKTGK
jgi:hypothetical protein